MSTTNPASLYVELLSHCSPLRFPSPWHFLAPPADFYGPLGDPLRTLVDLRRKFSDQDLTEAGIVEKDGAGSLRLVPALAAPQAVLHALRGADPSQPPKALLTRRGWLGPDRHAPFVRTSQDPGVRSLAAHHGVLLAAADLLEVALLRSLKLPAAHALGLRHLPAVELRHLNDRFAVQDYTPARPSLPEARPEARLPTLALLGWSPLALSPRPSPLIRHATQALLSARRHLRLPLAGVVAWRLPPGQLEHLRYHLTLSQPEPPQELLLESLDSFVEISSLDEGGAGRPAPSFQEARGELLARLGGDDDRVQTSWQQAQQLYEDAVRRELIHPLLDWALQSSDPVERAAGVQLANVAEILHRVSPGLLAPPADAGGPADPRVPLPDKLLGQYGTLLTRFGTLARDLKRWRS